MKKNKRKKKKKKKKKSSEANPNTGRKTEEQINHKQAKPTE